MAKEAFAVSSHYDSAIFNYFDAEEGSAFRQSANDQKMLRYGENPHQKDFSMEIWKQCSIKFMEKKFHITTY